MSPFRKVLVVVGVLVGVLLLAALALVLFFPAERVGQMAVDQAEEALDREVRIEGFGVRLLPRPAVTVEGVAVSRHTRPGEAGDAPEGEVGDIEPLLASVGRIELRPRILPLVRGDVVVNEVALDQPDLRLVVREDGELDLPEVEGDPEGDAAEIEIRRVIVRGGAVEYRDEGAGMAFSATGIDHTLDLAGAVSGEDTGPLTVTGSGAVAEVSMERPDAPEEPLDGVRLSVEHDLQMDPGADRLELRSLALTAQGLPLEVTGAVDALSDPDARSVALEARSDGWTVARVMEAIPAALLDDVGDDALLEALAGLESRLDLDASVDGPVGNGRSPTVAGGLRVVDEALAHAEAEAGEALTATFQVGNWADDALGEVSLVGDLDLEGAAQAGLLPEDLQGRGRARPDLRLEGLLEDLAAATVDGSVQVSGFELDGPALDTRVEVADGRVDFSDRQLQTEDLSVALGDSDLAADLRLEEWLTLAFQDGPRPSGELELRSSFLDLDALTEGEPDGASYGQLFFAELGGQELDGLSAADHAEAQGLNLPELPDLDLNGRLLLERVVSTGVDYEGVEGDLVLEDDGLEMPSLRFSTMGGLVELGGRLGPAEDDGSRTLNVEYRVDEVTADPFLEHHTLFRGTVGGLLELEGTAEATLASSTLPLRESVGADALLEVLGGELSGWPLVTELGESIGVDVGPLEFSDWRGGLRIEESRFLLEESTLQAGDMEVRSSGSFDVAGNLDLTATFELPRAWMAEVPGVPSGLLDSLLGQEGTVPVDATITGTTRSPSISLDLPG